MSGKYDDIINMAHPTSKTHPRMSLHDRAAQFSPFSALTGYEEAIEESARLTETMPILDENEKAILNRKLFLLMSRLEERPDATISFFTKDALKDGGKIETVLGRIERIDPYKGRLTFVDSITIKTEDILSVDSPIFNEDLF